MITVEIGGQKIEVTATPIIITVEKTYSKQLFIFYVNGQKYEGLVSDHGRLVVNKGVK